MSSSRLYSIGRQAGKQMYRVISGSDKCYEDHKLGENIRGANLDGGGGQGQRH